MKLWESPLITNLKDGNLPEVKTLVTVEPQSLVKIGLLVVLCTAVILVLVKISKNID